MVTRNVEEQLMDSLQGKAGQVRSRHSLAEGAIQQAHGIRRRRRVVGAAVAAVLVAVAVPVGIEATSAIDGRGVIPARPDPHVQLDLKEFEQGEAPTVVYAEGRTIHAGGGTIEVPDSLPGEVGVLAWTQEGVYLSTQDFATGAGSFDLIRSEGGEVIHLADAGVFRVLASADGRYIAYVDGRQLTFIDLETSAMSEVTLPSADTDLLQIVGDSLYLGDSTKVTEGRLFKVTVGDQGLTMLLDGNAPTAVSPDGEYAAFLTEFDELEPGSCSEVRELSTGMLAWRTCDYMVDGFSTDGAYALAGPEYRDGYADTTAAVLDATDGAVLTDLSNHRPQSFASIMRTGFEDESHVLLQVEQYGQTAIVRCDVDTNLCENATPPQAGTVDGGDSPYSLGSL